MTIAGKIGERPSETLTGIATRSAALVLVFCAFDRLVDRATDLPEAAYHESSIAWEVVRGGGVASVVLLLVWLVAIGAGFRRGASSRSWERGSPIRAVVGVAVLILAWAYSTYAFNSITGRAHGFDRALLVAFACASLFRPGFLLPFAVLVVAILGQFSAPLPGFSSSEPSLLVHIVLVAAAAWWLRALVGKIWSRELAILLFATVASHYWASGIGKVVIGWLELERISCVPVNTYANGWMPSLTSDEVASLAMSLARFDPLLVWATVIIECAGAILLARSFIAAPLFAGWIVFHASVFSISGICFWKWLLIDLAFLAFLARPARLRLLDVARPAAGAIAFALVLASPIWLRPDGLVWFDTPVAYTYRLELEGEDGRRRELEPSYFAPFDYQFTLGTFPYLAADRNLGLVWGATKDVAIAKALRDARSPEDVFAIEGRLGKERHDPTLRARFETFLQRFVTARSASPEEASWPPFRAPPQLWTGRRDRDEQDDRDRRIDERSRPRRVHVERVTTFWDGRSSRVIRRTPLLSVELERGGGAERSSE